jgi:predicted lipoprotein with Yx(FWY)xxD motif
MFTSKGIVMKLRSLIAAPILLAACGLFLAGCGQASQVSGSPAISPAAAAVVAPSSASAAVTSTKAAEVAPAALAQAGTLGQVLVGANGHTLYAFTKDVDGVSTCFDACAAAWPAVTVTAGFTPPAGVNAALVGTVDRPDGSKQLKIGKWPLYFYAGDGAPGKTNGQGVGAVWFAQAADGTLVKGAVPAPAAAAAPAPAAAAPAPAPVPAAAAAAPAGPVVNLAQVGNLGEVMVGANGHTLYAFTDDPEKQTSCFDACAKAWPPLTVGADFTITDELQASGATTIDRPDGSKQLVMGKWALYYFAGDAAPGDANGQGSNGKWFAIDVHCKLVKTTA